MNKGTLYIVATPIGNLGDITLRAIEVLKKVDFIACEDTRHSAGLFQHFQIKKPLLSYHDFSERQKTPLILKRLEAGESAALVSDAGTPGIADPGYRLINGAIEAGIKIEFLPGPSALIAALVLSGLPSDRFIFEGFVPVKSGQKKNKFMSLKDEERTVIFYESPHRLLKTLETLQEALGNISIVVIREISKKFEETVRGAVSEVKAYFEKGKVLGEFVILWSLKR